MEKTLGSLIEVDSVFDDAEWTEFVESAPDATVAHLIGWRELIHRVFGYQPAYRVARRDGRICGALPAFVVASRLLGRHIISVPFLNQGGICAADEESRQALLEESRRMLDAYCARHVEMRCACPPPVGLLARTHKIRLVLDLPSTTDQVWTSLRSEIRNRVRRAEKCGLSVHFHSSEVDGFYRIFADNMHELGVPAHPRRFFEEVLAHVGHTSQEGGGGGAGSAELVTVRDGLDVVGGAILLQFRDSVEVPWVSCSRSHFDKCPNNLLYWHILRRACEQGYRLFDFGRSTPNTGPAVFKMRWGARAEQLYWHYVVPEGAALPGEASSRDRRFRLASAIWKRAPRVLTNFLGPRLIAHLPG